MHSHIRTFPSYKFYNNLITDDDSVLNRGPLPVLIQNLESSKLFARVNFLDLPKSQESIDETSKTNTDEARYTLALLQTFLDSLCSGSSGNLKGRVGIITPYKTQVKLLK